MIDRHLPGMTPTYVRLELHYEGELGWTLRTYEGDEVRFITRDDERVYGFLTGPEAAAIVADVLDATLGG